MRTAPAGSQRKKGQGGRGAGRHRLSNGSTMIENPFPQLSSGPLFGTFALSLRPTGEKTPL
eukprot:6619296-Alexandrium_andersonii.AAC.1